MILPVLPSEPDTAVIPAVLHQVWVGPPPPSWVVCSWQHWQRALPAGWEFRIWDRTRCQRHPALAKTLALPGEISPRGLSNLLRVQIVGLEGGVYTDVDCVPVGEIDHLAGDRPPWIACAAKSRTQHQMENSCFGFPAGHPFLAEVNARADAALRRGVQADYHLGGSRTFRTVWDTGRYPGVQVRWDYPSGLHPDLRTAFTETGLPTAEIAARLGHPIFPIGHVMWPGRDRPGEWSWTR